MYLKAVLIDFEYARLYGNLMGSDVTLVSDIVLCAYSCTDCGTRHGTVRHGKER